MTKTDYETIEALLIRYRESMPAEYQVFINQINQIIESLSKEREKLKTVFPKSFMF